MITINLSCIPTGVVNNPREWTLD